MMVPLLEFVLSLFFSTVVLGSFTATATNITPFVGIATPDSFFGGSDNDAYQQWVQSRQGASYTGLTYVAADGNTTAGSNGVAIHWRVDAVNELLYVAVAARAMDGWIAFGIADAGGMRGSDIVIYETSKPDRLTDAHVLYDRVAPFIDDCQDWTLAASYNEDGFLIFEGIRKFDTKDAQDHIILDDTAINIPAQRVIAAWGDSDTMQYHSTKRARSAVRWFGAVDEQTSFRKLMKEQASGFFDMYLGNFTIPTLETEYVDFCYNWGPDFVPQGVPADSNVVMVGAEMILDPIAGPYIHHATTVGGVTSLNESLVCQEVGVYNYPIYSWAFGAQPFLFPSDVGMTLGPGEKEGVQSFFIQVHYSNPQLVEGLNDTSTKFRVYYSVNPRKYEVGIMSMADPSNTVDTPIRVGSSRFDFACGDECSSLILDGPVTVINEVFHMHNRGTAALQYQIRDGEVIHKTNVNFFDFDQAGTIDWQIIPRVMLCFTLSNHNSICLLRLCFTKAYTPSGSHHLQLCLVILLLAAASIKATTLQNLVAHHMMKCATHFWCITQPNVSMVEVHGCVDIRYHWKLAMRPLQTASFLVLMVPPTHWKPQTVSVSLSVHLV
jgi:DOMON domain/Copper type II ascorbate-dependent monooxygenase, N-terminal domain